jgi:hypothetical protein
MPPAAPQRQRDQHDPTSHPVATKPETFVTRDWVDTVFHTIDTPLRTHRITLSYSKFATYLDDHLFGAGSVRKRTSADKAIKTANANWFNFATWGTYTLGPNIRNDGAPQRLESLPNSIRRRVAPGIIQSRSADGELVGRALAWGQELIFLSASDALLRFKRGASSTKKFESTEADRARVLKLLNWSGQRWIDNGHLDLVDRAFECYRLVRRRVAHMSAGKADADAIQADPYVARMLLLATCLLTAAEQDVVNKALAVVIDSVPERAIRAIDSRVSKLEHLRRGVPQQVAAFDLLDRLKQAEGVMSDVWARLMTKYLLVIVLPTEMLRLGRDVPLRNPTSQMYPQPLMDLRVPGLSRYEPSADKGGVEDKLHDLLDFMSTFDRSQGGVGSAAHDWRRFDDRMNWAVNLFRSRQQDRSLYWSPYSVEDTRRIVAGEMPRASGHPGQTAVMPPLDPPASIPSQTQSVRAQPATKEG